MNIFTQLQGLIGIALILFFSWLLSENRKERPKWLWILAALGMQLLFALLIVRVPLIWDIVSWANSFVAAIESATRQSTSFMFGYLGGAELPFVLKEGAGVGPIIAFQILPLIVVFSTISALLWHWGVLKLIVRFVSWALRRSLGVSGPLGLAGGASLFLGPVEAPLLTRPWLGSMSRSELFATMVLSMATISGTILVLYATTLREVLPDAVGHMIAASIISLPAAFLLARLMVPGKPAEHDKQVAPKELRYANTLDAIAKGAMDGMQLLLAVIAIIIVIFALVALLDQGLAFLPQVMDSPITLKRIFGWLFAPLMWTIGVPWSEAVVSGGLMGTKAILNEYVAYLEMAGLGTGVMSLRTELITVYALCGVANLASIGLLVSTIGTLAPERRAEVSALGIKSWIAGNFASMMTGAVVGLVTWA